MEEETPEVTRTHFQTGQECRLERSQRIVCLLRKYGVTVGNVPEKPCGWVAAVRGGVGGAINSCKAATRHLTLLSTYLSPAQPPNRTI